MTPSPTPKSEQDILEKAIKQAIDGGWPLQSTHSAFSLAVQLVVNTQDYPLLIFDHDFAKAVWGKDTYRTEVRKRHIDGLGDEYDEVEVRNPGWQYHLQQMVIADDPIAYLGEHLESAKTKETK